jgi:hypothetical protein
MKYVLGEELTDKVAHDQAWDNKLTTGQRGGLAALFAEARQREDLGANAIWKPAMGGTRPSAIYARGVTSLETAALDMEAVVRTQPRVKQPVHHYVISLTCEESKTVSDEQLIRAAEHTLDRSGWLGHSAIFAVHRDTENVHCHVAIASVHPDTLRAWNRQNDYYRLHHALRETELKFGMQHENGLAIVRDRGLPTERIEWASLETRKTWSRNRQAERLEDMARAFLDESDGLESVEDRRDRIVYAIREYLSKTTARGERPLRADVHAIAARLTAVLETDSDGALHARLMERAPEGTVAREEVDSFGELTPRFARWQPTNTVFSLDAELLAPSPYDAKSVTPKPDGAAATPREQREHAIALRNRAWLSQLGNVERSEVEIREVVQSDPGRVARDIVASGRAVFSAEDIDRWCGERISADWLAVSNEVQCRDTELELLSPDAHLPLYTTKTQRALEQAVFDLATRLAKERDPFFDRDALDRAIREEEQALGIAFSAEQLAVFDLLEYRFAVVQGDAGTGKSTLMAVQRRYCEFTGREIAGFATSQLAAENLGEKARIRAVNTARAQALEVARGEQMIRPNSRAILDEASMLSLESVHATLQRLESQGAGGLFIGDLAQLPNIAAGDTGRLLTSVAQATDRYAEVTQVFRQHGPEVAWMRTAVPVGGCAIREGDAAGFRAYLEAYVDRGHVLFHENRKDEIAAKAHDVVEAVKRGVSVLAPGFSRQDCLYTNRAIRAGLGHEGKGIAFRLARGVRELSPNDRVIFEKNAEARLGVLNGYTGRVRSVSIKHVEVELDGGRIVRVNPAVYPHLEYGWATTTHKSQGRGDPLVIPTLGKNDDARSAHVALTRCETGLRVHTRLSREELVDHLSSQNAMRPKDDVLFFEEIVRRTGGPDTFWAQAVRTAMEKEHDPLREEHRAEMRLRTEVCRREIVSTLQRFQAARSEASNNDVLKRIERQEKRELSEVYKRHELEPFVRWALRRRMVIERSCHQAKKRKSASVHHELRPSSQEHDIQVKRGRRR